MLFSLGSFVMCIFAFCHRIFICASTVLVTIAALLSTLGAGIFYGYANYQDNKVIREEDEDEIYEVRNIFPNFYSSCATIGQFFTDHRRRSRKRYSCLNSSNQECVRKCSPRKFLLLPLIFWSISISVPFAKIWRGSFRFLF